jgi:hypothetical protein
MMKLIWTVNLSLTFVLLPWLGLNINNLQQQAEHSPSNKHLLFNAQK